MVLVVILEPLVKLGHHGFCVRPIMNVVNSDLKLIQFSTKQRFKTDTPPLRSHTTYAFDAVSRLLFTIPAAR